MVTSPVVQSVGPAQQAPRIWVSGKGPSHRTKGNAQGVGPAWLETSTLGPFLGNLTKSLEHSPAWLVGVQPGRALKAQKARTLSWETIKTQTKPSAQRYLVQVFVFLRTQFKNNLKIQDQGIIKHILAQAFTGAWQSSRSVPAMCTPTTLPITQPKSLSARSPSAFVTRLNAEGMKFSKDRFKSPYYIGRVITSINSTAYCVTLSKSLNFPLLKSPGL